MPIFYGLLSGAFWGLSFVLPVYLSHVPAIWISFGRFLFLGLISFLFLVWSNKRIRVNLKFLLLAAMGNSLYYYFLILSIEGLGVVLPTLVIGLLPLTTFVFGTERFSKQMQLQSSFMGLSLVIGGIAFSVFDRVQELQFKVWPFILCLLSLVQWTIYSVWNSREIKKTPEITAIEWTSIMGVSSAIVSALILGLGFIFNFEEQLRVYHQVIRPQLGSYLVVSAILGVGGGWIAFILWNKASQKLSAQIAGQLIVSETFFGILYLLILEHRLPTLSESLAVALLSLGVLYLIRVWYFTDSKH